MPVKLFYTGIPNTRLGVVAPKTDLMRGLRENKQAVISGLRNTVLRAADTDSEQLEILLSSLSASCMDEISTISDIGRHVEAFIPSTGGREDGLRNYFVQTATDKLQSATPETLRTQHRATVVKIFKDVRPIQLEAFFEALKTRGMIDRFIAICAKEGSAIPLNVRKVLSAWSARQPATFAEPASDAI